MSQDQQDQAVAPVPMSAKEMDQAHGRYMRSNGDSFRQFMRNRVWGTCGGCPRDNNGHAYPEFCQDFKRYDHQLTPEGLFEQYQRLARKA